jgi:hypothetical protein
MNDFYRLFAILVLISVACSFASTPAAPPTPVTKTSAAPITETATPPPPTETLTPVPSFTPTPTEMPTSSPVPTVESLDARVAADLLTCRYGPGSEYLYLVAFNKNTPIQLIGQTGGNNWVLVENRVPCWVNAKFLEIKGDKNTLRVMYPDGFKLIVSPYYSPPIVLSAVRDPNNKILVTVEWSDITLRAGDEEDENMFIYIIEVWRCEGGKIIFDPLPSNYPEITFVDEPGCSTPSHGRVYFQEKHGYAGPAEIPWPAQ